MENIFGDNLRRIRLSKNMTQANLGKLIYLTGQAISRWEKGETSPDVDTLIQLAKAFDVDANTLLGSNLSEKPLSLIVNNHEPLEEVTHIIIRKMVTSFLMTIVCLMAGVGLLYFLDAEIHSVLAYPILIVLLSVGCLQLLIVSIHQFYHLKATDSHPLKMPKSKTALIIYRFLFFGILIGSGVILYMIELTVEYIRMLNAHTWNVISHLPYMIVLIAFVGLVLIYFILKTLIKHQYQKLE